MKHSIFAEYYDDNISFNHYSYTDMNFSGFEAHTHQAFEIIYVKEGDLTYVVNEKMYHVQKNSLILTRPNNTHIIYFNQKKYSRYDIIVAESLIHPDVYQKFPKDVDVISVKKPQPFLEIFGKMDFFCNHFTGDALRNILSNVIEEIFYYLLVVTATVSDEISLNTYTTDSLLSKVISYIEQNLYDGIRLEQMCRELYISKSYLHRIFSEHLQTTPKKYITARRLALAQKELQAGARPTEVYIACGFLDYSSFYRSYQKHFGYPPSKELDKKIIKIKY